MNTRREWVKTFAIVFLLILLGLTFFSNTIMNMSLAEVSTVAVEDGTISARIRASGKASAAGVTKIKADGTRTVAAVKVKVGQEVSEGDVLFVMGEAASDELEAAIESRDAAEWSLKRAQNSYPVDTTASSKLSADAAATSLEYAQQALDEANAVVAQYTIDNDDVERARSRVVTAEENLAKAIENAEIRRQQAYLNVEAAQSTMDSLNSAAQAAEAAYANATDPIEKETLRIKYETAVNEANDYYENRYKELEETYIKSLDSDDTEVEAAEEALVSAEYTYNALIRSYESASSSLQSALEKRDSAQSSFDIALQNYYTACAQQSQNVGTAWINEQEAQQTLEKKQAKVDKLQGVGEDANVYATVGGIIETISFSSGDKVTKDDIMCTIEVPDMGYTMEVSVTKDQASRVKVGDVGTAGNAYWGKTIEGVITNIKADPSNPQEKRILTFELSGDITAGQEIQLSVGNKTASYDYVVPKSAVRSDNNGSFVLVITSKNNALGNRYFAKRVSVEILAEDDSYRAISGDISYGDFIITNSSTKVNSGDQVKLADAS